jgi:hypothetical protein
VADNAGAPDRGLEALLRSEKTLSHDADLCVMGKRLPNTAETTSCRLKRSEPHYASNDARNEDSRTYRSSNCYDRQEEYGASKQRGCEIEPKSIQ